MVNNHLAAVAVMFVAAAVPPAVQAQEPKPAPAPAAATPAVPQDAKTLLANVAKAMGAESVKTIQYTGSGSNAGIGQNRNPDADWPLVRVKSYTRDFDFGTPVAASRAQLVRVQGGAEQKQEQTILPTAPWGQQYDVWLSPFAFLKGAMANATTIEARTVLGVPYTVATFTLENKYKVSGYIDSQNMIHKVETWVDNPVFGDLKVEALYTDYRDFTGVKFPMTIINKQDGRNTLILVVNEVKPNAPVTIQAPAPAAAAAPAAPAAVTVQSQEVAPGIFYLMGGSHHSVAVEFADHIAVIEAPQNEARSLAVIAEVRKAVGRKPIRYLINTHHHFDHSGGLRTYVEAGATIVTHDVNKAFYERVLAPTAPRTLGPDRLALAKKAPVLKIETVADKKVMSDKTRTLELHHIAGNAHNDGILLAYLPAEKIVIEVDLYTPLAAGAKPPAAVSPNTTNLLENVERLKLDFDKVLALHGPGVATKADLYSFAGKPLPAAAGN